jgi:DNA ligase (NAD+)
VSNQLSQQQAAQRIAKLRTLINDYRYHYHVLDDSIMSEAAADSLKHELTQLETAYPDLITPDSPSQRVAGTVSPEFTSVQHSSRMLSLNDVFNAEEVAAWQARIAKLVPKDYFKTQALEYFVDIKMDGLACALHYQDGLLLRGITRGDGFVGEDVTANIRTIESIPLSLRSSPEYTQLLVGATEVRGEIVMYKVDFAALNAAREAEGKPLFANPRNTAAGTIRQLDPRLVASRKLTFRAYDLRRDEPSEVPTNQFAYQALRTLGFLANPDAQVLQTVDQVMAFVHEWEIARQKLPFNTDGLVVKVNDRRLFDRLGVVGKAPRAAVAFKYAAEQATTKVKDIFVSIGRTGAATPVAILQPVVIAGSTVQMATLHNEGEVQRKDIRVGDTVIVHKAGDIIPEVVEPLTSLRDGSEKPFVMPVVCPECNTTLVKLKAEDAAWRCPNENCPSRAWKRIEHFASKAALDIEGLGEKNVIALLQTGLINDPADIFTLDKAAVLGLDRFAEISASKLIAAISSKKQPTLARFLYGLGIRHIGVQTAIDLANHFRTIEALSQAEIDELSHVEGIGDIVAEAVVEWFAELRNQKLLTKFVACGVQPQEVKQVGGKLSGQNFVVTGHLEHLSRDEAAERIRGLGGVFQSSVGKDTDYLVVGQNVGVSKLKKADKFGTKQMSEADLIRLLSS